MISTALLILNFWTPGSALAGLHKGQDVTASVSEANAAVVMRCEGKCATQIATPNFNAPAPDRKGYAKMAEQMAENNKLPPPLIPSQTVPGN